MAGDLKSAITSCNAAIHTYSKVNLLYQDYFNIYQERTHEFVQGGAQIFFSFQWGAQHSLGPENPMKSIDFTGPGGA